MHWSEKSGVLYSEWIRIQEIIEEKRIDLSLMIIIMPSKGIVNEFPKLMANTPEMIDYIYFDYFGLLEKKNPHLPKSKSLHTFLMDKNGKVLLVGNPVRNNKINALMLDILEDK